MCGELIEHFQIETRDSKIAGRLLHQPIDCLLDVLEHRPDLVDADTLDVTESIRYIANDDADRLLRGPKTPLGSSLLVCGKYPAGGRGGREYPEQNGCGLCQPLATPRPSSRRHDEFPRGGRELIAKTGQGSLCFGKRKTARD